MRIDSLMMLAVFAAYDSQAIASDKILNYVEKRISRGT